MILESNRVKGKDSRNHLQQIGEPPTRIGVLPAFDAHRRQLAACKLSAQRRIHMRNMHARNTHKFALRATAFQMKVWGYLQLIPYGGLQSYGEVTAGLGESKAVRAVACACASNRIAVLIPCHRVIRGTAELGGYKWASPENAQSSIHNAITGQTRRVWVTENEGLLL